MNRIKNRAGNNGIISYNTLDSNRVEIVFEPIVCEDQNKGQKDNNKGCNSTINYYLLIANSP